MDALIASERAQNADDGSKILKVAGSLAVNAGSSVGDLAAGLGGLQGALRKFIGSTDSDKEHLNGLASLTSGVNARADDGGQAKKAYMAAVSPWFFTHYSPETFNKNVRLTANTYPRPVLTNSLVHIPVRPTPVLQTLGVPYPNTGPAGHRANPDMERLRRVTLHWPNQRRAAQ